MADNKDTQTKQANDKELKHTEGGTTTRSDLTDLGVPMLPGDPNEPVGPEDALGEGPKRGDYSKRLGDANYQPHQVVPDTTDGDAAVKVIDQAPLASVQGEEAGEKGGVTTTA